MSDSGSQTAVGETCSAGDFNAEDSAGSEWTQITLKAKTPLRGQCDDECGPSADEKA